MSKKTMQICAFAACAAMLGACSGQDSDLSAALRDHSDMPSGIADCVSDLAQQELSEDARRFLVASISKDDSRAAELRDKMQLSELASTGMFMVSASGRCGAPID